MYFAIFIDTNLNLCKQEDVLKSIIECINHDTEYFKTFLNSNSTQYLFECSGLEIEEVKIILEDYLMLKRILSYDIRKLEINKLNSWIDHSKPHTQMTFIQVQEMIPPVIRPMYGNNGINQTINYAKEYNIILCDDFKFKRTRPYNDEELMKDVNAVTRQANNFIIQGDGVHADNRLDTCNVLKDKGFKRISLSKLFSKLGGKVKEEQGEYAFIKMTKMGVILTGINNDILEIIKSNKAEVLSNGNGTYYWAGTFLLNLGMFDNKYMKSIIYNNKEEIQKLENTVDFYLEFTGKYFCDKVSKILKDISI